MAGSPYGLNDLVYTGQKIKTSSGSENFQMRVWGGSLRVNITKEKEFKPIFERAISADKCTILKHVIKQVQKASPGSKFPIVFNGWDKNEKKSIVDFVITFLKDEKNCYHIEMQWKGNKFDCLLKGPYGVSFGSDPMSDADKSAIELETMYDWLDNIAPLQCVLTNRKREFDASANGSSYTTNKGSSSGDSASGGDSFFD